jgi:DNA polymerase-3 subunit gamma/tau
LLRALAENDPGALMAQIAELHDLVPEYASVLDGLAALLQQVAVVQLAGVDCLDEDADLDALREFADAIGPEDVQLMYQIAVTGRRDIGLAPDPRIGFEMALLRMLCFRPAGTRPAQVAGGSGSKQPDARPSRRSGAGKRAPAKQPRRKKTLPPDADWASVVAALDLRGAVRQLAEHCALAERDDTRLTLALNKSESYLLTEQQQQRLVDALRECLGASVKVVFRMVDEAGETIASQAEDKNAQAMEAAKESIASDPQLQELVDLFGAEIETESIRPVENGNSG